MIASRPQDERAPTGVKHSIPPPVKSLVTWPEFATRPFLLCACINWLSTAASSYALAVSTTTNQVPPRGDIPAAKSNGGVRYKIPSHRRLVPKASERPILLDRGARKNLI